MSTNGVCLQMRVLYGISFLKSCSPHATELSGCTMMMIIFKSIIPLFRFIISKHARY